MPKNPFTDRPEESKNNDMLHIGDRVLIVEKHMQGTDKKEELTDGIIVAKLTSKKFHPQGVKVRIEKIDGGEYAVGRVQYLVDDGYPNVEEGDIVSITKSKNPKDNSQTIEGVVIRVVSKEGIGEEKKFMVELVDGTIGWVQDIILKIEE